MAEDLLINVGGVWKSISDCEINVGGVWKTPTEVKINVGGVWKLVWPVAGGDTIDLRAMSAEDEGDYTADARCTLYGQSHANEGEQWWDDGPTNTYQNDVITPTTNTDNYQVKWAGLSGDDPTLSSTAENVWESLDLDTFFVEWSSEGDQEVSGSVTVSIREGTGSVLDTAVWDGLAVSVKDKK